MSAVTSPSVVVWGFSVPTNWLTTKQASYLAELPTELPTVEWIWEEMDRVWSKYRIDNRKPLSGQAVGDFYSHPVWLMNGIFTAVDPVSASHRRAIARYINEVGARAVADFGGGFGELALGLSRLNRYVGIDIVEPYPSRVAIERLSGVDNIKMVGHLASENYDVIVAQDVLEHVEDPIKMAHSIASGARKDGLVIFANCFYPVIQCHLPETFHLRHTFRFVMKALGLRYVGVVDGAAHAQIFRRTGVLDLAKARRAEAFSKTCGPALNRGRATLSALKRIVIRK